MNLHEMRTACDCPHVLGSISQGRTITEEENYVLLRECVDLPDELVRGTSNE